MRNCINLFKIAGRQGQTCIKAYLQFFRMSEEETSTISNKEIETLKFLIKPHKKFSDKVTLTGGRAIIIAPPKNHWIGVHSMKNGCLLRFSRHPKGLQHTRRPVKMRWKWKGEDESIHKIIRASLFSNLSIHLSVFSPSSSFSPYRRLNFASWPILWAIWRLALMW